MIISNKATRKQEEHENHYVLLEIRLDLAQPCRDATRSSHDEPRPAHATDLQRHESIAHEPGLGARACREQNLHLTVGAELRVVHQQMIVRVHKGRQQIDGTRSQWTPLLVDLALECHHNVIKECRSRLKAGCQ